MKYLGYCGYCALVGEVSTGDAFSPQCPHCRADSPRGVDSLPDWKIAELVEHGQLTHDDLAKLRGVA
jgi:hypothetical protein